MSTSTLRLLEGITVEYDHSDIHLNIPMEMFDFVKVMEFGAEKHGASNFLEKNGRKSDRAQMYQSLSNHLEGWKAGEKRDHESGLHPLLHLACRALMMYTREKRRLVHELDEK